MGKFKKTKPNPGITLAMRADLHRRKVLGLAKRKARVFRVGDGVVYDGHDGLVGGGRSW